MFYWKHILTAIKGAISITQSNAILRYIARKNDMCGKTEQEKVWVDMMADEAMDFRNGWVRLCYCPFMGQKFVSYKIFWRKCKGRLVLGSTWVYRTLNVNVKFLGGREGTLFRENFTIKVEVVWKVFGRSTFLLWRFSNLSGFSYVRVVSSARHACTRTNKFP